MQQLLLGLLCRWKPLALEGSHGFPQAGQVQRVVTALVTMKKLTLITPGQSGKCLEPCLVLSWQLWTVQAPKLSGC